MQCRTGCRRAIGWLSVVAVTACSGGDDGGGNGITPPPGPEAVASVAVTPPASSILAGQTVQLSAIPHSAQGAVLSGRAITWSTSNPSVATVSGTGLVNTVGPGNVTITATVESRQGNAAIESVDPTYIPVLQRPFNVSYEPVTTNYHDHDVPKEFVDNNGLYLSWWGEHSRLGIDGHEGYDWQMPVGTPILAAAAGRVVAAVTSHAPSFCPILNRDVTDSHRVDIEHTLPGGVRVRSRYVHFSSIAVVVGQDVAAGQQIGLSGATGCALNPHLHFQVNRLTQLPAGVTSSPIDPYGWDSPSPDPWASDPAGAQSINLWKPNEAPALYRWSIPGLPETPGAWVILTAVRVMGARDDVAPNNEMITATLDTRVAPETLDISNFLVTNLAGDTLRFPPGSILTTQRTSISVHTGPGTDTETTKYFGRAAGVFDNNIECIRFYNAAGQLRNQVGWNLGCQ